MLWNNQCIDKCPPLTFHSPETNSCSSCEYPCLECEGSTKCSSCSEEFYWHEGECLKSCPEGRYPDNTKKTCEVCSEQCLTCYGPSSRECIKCNYLDKYNKTTTGECKILACKEHTYVHINYEEAVVECLDCHKYCLNCNGGEKDDCTECSKGYITFPGSDKEGKVICKTCNEVNAGYYTDPDGTCKGKVTLNQTRSLRRWYQLRNSGM